MDDKTTTVAELKQLVADFVAERDWQQFHDPKNLSMSIAIEAAELMEHFQWVRSEELDAIRSEGHDHDEVAAELADVLAFAVSLANALDIDIADAMQRKMVRNAEKYPAERFKGRYK